MKQDYTLLIGALAALTPLTSCGDKEAQPKERPNILFIMADDHTRAAISAYGGIYSELAPTPNIDEIAADGAIFDHCVCTNSISGPSRASLVTGKYSTTNGFYQNEGGIVFDNTQQQYQKILQENGYNTALIGKWHLMSEPKGFDFYMIHDDPSQQGSYWGSTYNTNGVKAKHEGYSTNIEGETAIEWLKENGKGEKPFAMMLHFKAPHRGWDPDSCYMDLYEEIDFPLPATFDDDAKGRELTLGQSMGTIENHLSRGDMKQTPPEGLSGKERNEWLWYGGSGEGQFWTPDPKLQGAELKNWKFQIYLKNYLRCVRSVDDQVGNVIKYLKDNDLYENTIVIYMGDQGFYLGEHGLYDKRWMYEESLMMPFIISYPNGGIEAGSKFHEIAANVDIAPTLLSYAGVEVPSDMQGESMVELLEGDKAAADGWRESIYYQYFEYPKWHNVQPHYGVRTDRYKLIHFYYNIDVWEFYDLENDPNEVSNEINNPEYADKIAELKVELTSLQDKYNDNMSLDERRELTDRYMFLYEH